MPPRPLSSPLSPPAAAGPGDHYPVSAWSRREFLAMGALATALAYCPAAAAGTKPPAFRRRGFYLHGCWVMNHPFAVRTWQLEDFAQCFRLMKHLGYTTVMIWPTPECAPMPLSAEDRDTLRFYREVIATAQQAGIECWFAYCANVISNESVRATPWPDRSLYATTEIIKVDGSPHAQAYLAHRREVIGLINNADGLVLIDGDPGGYPGAPLAEFVEILKHDIAAMAGRPVVPWIWSGWGRDDTKLPPDYSYWRTPLEPFVPDELAAIKHEVPPPWELLVGRCHREGFANGRKNIRHAQAAGLLPRSTLMCYEVIEREPSQPAVRLQFDLIRDNLKEESALAATVKGVFGNAQQPLTVLPNLYFFARGAADVAYLDRGKDDVLRDLAAELGGDPELLLPAWKALELPLAELPADLPARLRASRLTTAFAGWLPGGPQRYLEILAAQAQSQRILLEACATPPATEAEAVASLVRGATALIDWWKVHRYIARGHRGDPFQWAFIHPVQYKPLEAHAQRCGAVGANVAALAAEQLARAVDFPLAQARRLIDNAIAAVPTSRI